MIKAQDAYKISCGVELKDLSYPEIIQDIERLILECAQNRLTNAIYDIYDLNSTARNEVREILESSGYKTEIRYDVDLLISWDHKGE